MEESTTQSSPTDSFQAEQSHLQSVQSRIRDMLERLYALEQKAENDADDRDEALTAEEVAQEVVERIRAEQIATLKFAHTEPYFGRLDFQERGASTPMPLYIGKRGVEDTDSGERMIIDWRAPVASLFYSFSGQDTASYESPDGTVEGQVFLKRNIAIRNGELQRVVDSYVHGQDNLNVTDEFLLYRLGENKDNRLRDIVSTIQAEQDRIIRADRNKAIVIQGVAGSGKTTVALHRLAYLLYQHADRLRADKMVIFAPNAMFVDYISEVLPELGVGGIQQTTFSAWALEILGHSVKLRDASDRLSRWFGVREDPAVQREFQVVRYKGSLEFLEQIERHLEAVEKSALPKGDFEAWEGKVLPESVIRDWFVNDYKHYPLAERRERVLARVKRWYEIEYKAMKSEDHTGALKKLAASRFRAYKNKWPQISTLAIYEEILSRVLPDADALGGQTVSTAKGRKVRPEVNVEDLAPLLYIHMRLHGIDSQNRFHHVVIDEAQDFSPLQIYVLKAYCPSESFTILGDLSQSIHTYQGITDWQSFLDLFDEPKRAYFQLDVSYRSTMEIIEFANNIIRPFKQFILAKPVFRSGEPVHVEEVSETERIAKIVKTIQELRGQANTIAVVGRTDEDCARLHRELQNAGVEANLIQAKDQRYAGGISVIPVYLTKGLEFDAVILVDVDENNYNHSPLSAKLLYVGCTRALHKLCVFYTGKVSPLLDFVESPAAAVTA